MQASSKSPYYSTTLGNGLRALHFYHKSRVAHCGVMIRAGAVDEAPQEFGLAHFVEHLLFKGTQKRRAHQVINRLERVGGDLNAFTSKEETFLYASFLKEHFERAIELLSDIVFHSIFPEQELRKEKEIVADEINSFMDTPEDAIYDEFEDRAYAGHPMGHNILGTAQTVRSFTVADVSRFMQKHYHPQRMVFVSIGAIEPAQLQNYLEKYFSVSYDTTPAQRMLHPAGFRKFYQRIRKNTLQSHVIVGTRAYPYGHRQRNVLSLINDLLGGSGMTSRLNMSLREKYGYSYQVESSYTPYLSGGIFAVYFATDRERIEKSLELVHKEFKKIAGRPLGKRQLMDAKKQMAGQLLISAENKENILSALARRFLYNNEIYDVEERIRQIEAITAEEIRQVASELFTKYNLSTLIYE